MKREKEQVVELTIDFREAPSGLIGELQDYEYTTTTTHVSTAVTAAQLPIGDIVCSDRVCVERKSCLDFVDTFIKRDLFGQIADLSRAYPKPVVILEGDTVFGIRDVHPRALMGALSAVAVGWGVPIIPTKSVEQTAAMVVMMAWKEQFKMGRKVSVSHAKRSSMKLPDQQTYFISAIRNLGPETAIRLLKHFGTPEAVVSATVDELTEVPNIGEKTAQTIREVVNTEYTA